MAYDVRDAEVVLFGGDNASNILLGDTWTYTSHGWNRDLPLISPSPRFGASMGYDPRLHAVVMFGGIFQVGSSYRILNDTWAFSAGQWTNLTATITGAPPSRWLAGMADDPIDGYLVVYGGLNSSGDTLGDTWSFDGRAWANLSAGSPKAPSPRYFVAMTYDAGDGYVLLVGGNDVRGNALGEQWKFVHGSWTHLLFAGPPPRTRTTIVYDPDLGAVELFGGLSTSAGTTLSDTWTYHGGKWTQLSIGAPPGRWEYASVYDDALAAPIMFGGICEVLAGNTEFGCNDTWEFHSNGGLWQPSNPAISPGARTGETLSWDPRLGGAVLFGGQGGSASFTSPKNDTWLFANGSWRPLPTGAAPPARVFASSTFDAADGYLLVFGGVNATGGVLNDTWVFASGSWHQMHPVLSPPAREYAELAYDPGSSTAVLFGGRGLTGPLNDTWTFAAGNWTLSPAGAPSPRFGAEMAFDDSLGAIVLFGGFDGFRNVLSDTWRFSGGTWSNVTPAKVPPGRYGAAMFYDPLNGELVVFGGAARVGIAGDTWAYDRSGWHNITARSPPLPRWFGAAAFLVDGNEGLLVGGFNVRGLAIVGDSFFDP